MSRPRFFPVKYVSAIVAQKKARGQTVCVLRLKGSCLSLMHIVLFTTLWAKRTSPPDFAQTPLSHFMGETGPNYPFRPYSAFPPCVQRLRFMGEKTLILRFRPDSAFPFYGRKEPLPPISPRLSFLILWAKLAPTIHFAHTQPSLHASNAPGLWAKRPSPPVFAQTPTL